jgi:hypothetical protein
MTARLVEVATFTASPRKRPGIPDRWDGDTPAPEVKSARNFDSVTTVIASSCVDFLTHSDPKTRKTRHRTATFTEWRESRAEQRGQALKRRNDTQTRTYYVS